MNNQNKSISKGAGLIKIGIDRHPRYYRVVRRIDQSNPQPPQKFDPVVFCDWLGKQLTFAERVVVCYEVGCCGYGAARRMQAIGVEVIAPQNWDEQGKRQVNTSMTRW
jgi:hypothetical protein